MRVVQNISELRQALDQARKADLPVGLVPTMGCLHRGHLSLIEKAKEKAKFIVVSIFVNPTQFGPNEDFNQYPRTLAEDCMLCEKMGVDIIFAPSVAEIYGANLVTTIEVGEIANGLCGAFRPGHFRGVATVVSILFKLIQPNLAVFGKKDFQQLAVIKQMVKDLGLPIEIISGETLRDSNGLAMSSRNRYLSQEEMQAAALIPASLVLAQEMVSQNETDAQSLIQAVTKNLAKSKFIKIQYVELVSNESLQRVDKVTRRGCTLAMACIVGKTRLIDNAELI
jgi:pantoate--beta-alanine ligase